MKKVILFGVVLFSGLLALAASDSEGVGAIKSAGGKAVQLTQAEPPANKNKEIVTEAKGAIKKAKVFFIEPKDGATVSTKFKIKMGVEGIKIRNAGEAPEEMTSGHHHVLIDQEAIPAGQPIPNDEHHIHFGKGQTETEITLPAGDHSLTLQFADGAHRSFGPALSSTIKVHVK